MKKRTIVSATDLRVRLGEMLRRLEDEDLVIEKGGIPVAVLRRYAAEDWAAGGGGERMMTNDEIRDAAYARTVGRWPKAGAWEDAMAVMREGWSGIDADEMKANIRRWRDEGTATRYYTFEEDGPVRHDTAQDTAAEEDGDEASDRQRRLYRPDERTARVADERDTEYNA